MCHVFFFVIKLHEPGSSDICQDMAAAAISFHPVLACLAGRAPCRRAGGALRAPKSKPCGAVRWWLAPAQRLGRRHRCYATLRTAAELFRVLGRRFRALRPAASHFTHAPKLSTDSESPSRCYERAGQVQLRVNAADGAGEPWVPQGMSNELLQYLAGPGPLTDDGELLQAVREEYIAPRLADGLLQAAAESTPSTADVQAFDAATALFDAVSPMLPDTDG